MDAETREMHLTAGEHYGRKATCGLKVDYKSEESANKAVAAMGAKGSKVMEAYPCFWCDGWHIGREMTETEVTRFSNGR